MNAPRELDVVFPLESERLAELLVTVLSVERDGSPPRTRVEISHEGPQVRIRIQAEDTRSLRAGANAFLRWADESLEILRAVVSSGESLKPPG